MYYYLVIIYVEGREEPYGFSAEIEIEESSPARMFRELASKAERHVPSGATITNIEITKYS